MVTATLEITLGSNFLSIQFIYVVKISKGVTAVAFLSEFVLNSNEKQYSNEKESFKVSEKIMEI